MKRISLSRAARLVGVKRGSLQLKIRNGELKTFEGEIVLTDLLQTYPNAQIEDTSMLERVEQIIENASFINSDSIQRRPDNQALSKRVKTLSGDLSQTKGRLKRMQSLLDTLVLRLQADVEQGRLDNSQLNWLKQALETIDNDEAGSEQQLANEVFLRTMTAQATLLGSGHEFFVEGAESILESGLRGGLALNYGCSNGNCGLCKMRVVSGETQKISHHDYVLSEAEKGLGYILSCSCTAVSDVVLEADEASNVSEIPRQQIPLRVKNIQTPNENILIVSAKTPRTKRLRFLAGQRAQLSCGSELSGSYPIASCPCDDMNLQFHIPVGANDALALHLQSQGKNNDVIELDGPIGDFTLDENSPNSLVFIAENNGFASIKGLIEHAMALDAAEHIYLFWLADDQQSLYLHNLCRAWNDALDNFDYIPLTNTSIENFQQTLLDKLKPANPAQFDFYLSACNQTATKMLSFGEQHGISRFRNERTDLSPPLMAR